MSLRAELSDVFMEKINNRSPPVIKFICDSFLFLPEQGCVKWANMVHAIEQNEHYKIDWAPSNAECYIETKDGFVYFAVSTYGNDCGGYLYVSLDSKKCLDAFKDASKMTDEWMEKTKA